MPKVGGFICKCSNRFGKVDDKKKFDSENQ